MPDIVIVAGPNGSGKTTVVRSAELAVLLPLPALSVNADDIAKALAGVTPPTDQQSLQAARIADASVDDLIARRQSFIVETVLSSDKYKSRVMAARAAGYRVILVFVTVRLLTLNIERVANRFALVPCVIYDAGHRARVGRRRAPNMTLGEHVIFNDGFH